MMQAAGPARYQRFEDYVVRDPRETSLPTALDAHTVENEMRFRRGWIQVRSYTWSSPSEDVFAYKPDAYVIDLALTPRPGRATIAHLGPGAKGTPRDLGRVVLIPPGSVARSEMSPGRQRSMHCVFDREIIEDVLPCRPEWDDRALGETVRLEGRELEWLLLKIYREVRQERFAGQLMVEAFASAVAVELARRFGAPEPRAHTGGLAPWRMRRLRERVYADDPAPSLAELAAICGMTVRQLSRAFKADTGQTVGKFVEAAMAERARTLLADAGLPVSEVAGRLGFANAASFAVAFRRATGLRPSEVEGRRQTRRSRPNTSKSD
jgi:AraC-like DNA-binding protein